jgi:hypothetical protein
MKALSHPSVIDPKLSLIKGLDVIGVTRTNGTLTIELRSKTPMRRFTVTAAKTLCVKEFDEGDALSYLEGLRIGVYCSEKSDLLDWFNSARSPLDPVAGLAHYILVSSDTIIEWLATTKPTVEATSESVASP